MGFKFERKVFRIEVEGKEFESLAHLNVSNILKEVKDLRANLLKLDEEKQGDGRETAKIIRGFINRIFGKNAYEKMFDGFDQNDPNLQIQLIAYITDELIKQQASVKDSVVSKYLGDTNKQAGDNIVSIQ